MKCLEEFCSEEENKKATGDEIFKANEILWRYFSKMYIPSIIYSHNPEVQIVHYFIHKRTPTCKCFSAVMHFTIINIIKIDSNEIQATT